MKLQPLKHTNHTETPSFLVKGGAWFNFSLQMVCKHNKLKHSHSWKCEVNTCRVLTTGLRISDMVGMGSTNNLTRVDMPQKKAIC